MELLINNIAKVRMQESSRIPDIPDVVIRNMLLYADANSLLNFRLASRKCHRLTNSVLRKSPIPIINFEESLEMLYSKFVGDFSLYLSEGLPFTNFSLYVMGIEPIQNFLSSVGHQIRSCTLDVVLPCKSDLLTYVHNLPKLETLSVKGRGMRDRQFLLQGPTTNILPKLTTLQLMDIDDRIFEIHLDVLNAWLRHLPSLKKLSVRCTIQVNNLLDYLEFLNEHSRLTEVTISVEFLDEMLFDKVYWPKRCVSPNLQLYTYIRNRNGALAAALHQHLSDVTYKVSLRLEQAESATIGHMPKLKIISLRGGGVLELEQFLHRNNLENFKALKMVYISAHNFDDRQDFREMSFSNVKSIHICHGFNEAGIPVVPYHKIFPCASTLAIEDSIFTEQIISYACEKWRMIVKLKLLVLVPCTSRLHDLLFRKETCEITNEKQKTLETNFGWALSRLEDLKELHIYDPYNIKSIIVNVAILTKEEKMPQLDHISFSGDTIAAERMLLKHCKWHKKIEFKQKSFY